MKDKETVMNKKLILWLGILALAAAPAVNVMAQGGPDEDGPEAGMMDDGPGRPELGEGPGPGFGPNHPMGMKGGESREMGRKKGLRGGPGLGGPGVLSEEATLALIKKHDAAFGKKVDELKTIAPAKYKIVLKMSEKLFAVAKMEQDESIEKDAVRGLALEFETKELSIKYGRAADADKKAIKETLRVKLAELFDLKSKAQELRVRHMEDEIAKLKKNLASRKVNKAKIVDQRLEQLTGEGLGW